MSDVTIISGPGFSVVVQQDDALHKWASVTTTNTSGRPVRVTGMFNAQPFNVTVADGTINRVDMIPGGVQLVQVTNWKGQVVWVPPAGFSIGFSTL